MQLGRKYLTNREFTKNIRHNGHNYIVSSVFDTDNSEFDFDATIAKYNYKENRWDFDKSIQNIQYNQFELSDNLTDLYNTGLFENKIISKRK